MEAKQAADTEPTYPKPNTLIDTLTLQASLPKIRQILRFAGLTAPRHNRLYQYNNTVEVSVNHPHHRSNIRTIVFYRFCL